MSVNNSTNAALLAARMLGMDDLDIKARVKKYISDSEAEVRQKDERLLEMGAEAYSERYLTKK